LARCAAAGVAAEVIGAVAGAHLVIGSDVVIDVADVAARRRGALEDQLSAN